jgi:hypothetical protein
VPIPVLGANEDIVILRDGGTYDVGVQPRVSVGAPAEPASAVQPIMASRGAPQ